MAVEKKKDLWNDIYNELKQPIPVDAVQTKDFGDKAQGYNIAYLIDRLNSVLFNFGCNWEQDLLTIGYDSEGRSVPYIRDIVETEYKGKKGSKESVCVRMKITIRNPDGDILAVKESFGGCQFLNNSLGDTLKGAQTDAMKKIFSYFGLGDSAYKGSIHEQLRGFKYKLQKVVDRISEVLMEVHGLETVNDNVLMRFVCSVVEKTYDGIHNLTEADIELINKELDSLLKGKETTAKPTKTKKVKNESKSKDGKDQVPVAEEQVDKPF